MAVVTVCKNVIAANNKRGWKNADPPIRCSRTPAGKHVGHYYTGHICDREGRIVATIKTTRTGKPIVKCGAKVAIFTKYPLYVKTHQNRRRA